MLCVQRNKLGLYVATLFNHVHSNERERVIVMGMAKTKPQTVLMLLVYDMACTEVLNKPPKLQICNPVLNLCDGAQSPIIARWSKRIAYCHVTDFT